MKRIAGLFAMPKTFSGCCASRGIFPLRATSSRRNWRTALPASRVQRVGERLSFVGVSWFLASWSPWRFSYQPPKASMSASPFRKFSALSVKRPPQSKRRRAFEAGSSAAASASASVQFVACW